MAADRAAVAERVSNLDTMEREPTDGTLGSARRWRRWRGQGLCRAGGALLAGVLHREGLCRLRGDVADDRGGGALRLRGRSLRHADHPGAQAIAGEPAFMADLVDLDRDSDTGVLWHCGLAPLSMADPEVRPRATVHSNRRKPLLMEFPAEARPHHAGTVQPGGGTPRLVIGGAEMLRRAAGVSPAPPAPSASTGRPTRCWRRSWRRGWSTTTPSPTASTGRH